MRTKRPSSMRVSKRPPAVKYTHNTPPIPPTAGTLRWVRRPQQLAHPVVRIPKAEPWGGGGAPPLETVTGAEAKDHQSPQKDPREMTPQPPPAPPTPASHSAAHSSRAV